MREFSLLVVILILPAVSNLFASGDEKTVQPAAGNTSKQSVGFTAPTTVEQLSSTTWYGKIKKNETKELQLNLLFPFEGKFFIEVTAGDYDNNLKVWKILGQYWGYVTIKKGQDGKIEKTLKMPKVSPQKVKAEGPVISSWYETAKRDTPQHESTRVKPRAMPNPPGPMPFHVSVQAGEPLIDLLVSFKPNPRVNEPTELILSLSSAIPRDSVCVYLLFTDSIKVIK